MLSSRRTDLDRDPFLLHVRNPKPSWDERSLLHCAAKHGHLDIVRLLVDRRAEVYSNPTSSYPPVIIAAWNKQQAVVDYFLNEIPDRALGTNKLGVTLSYAAREGWTDLVRRHIRAPRFVKCKQRKRPNHTTPKDDRCTRTTTDSN